MSVIIVEDGDSGESTADEVSEVAEEVAEAVSEAIADSVEAIVDSTESGPDGEIVAIVAGVTLEQVSALTQRVDTLEERVESIASTSSLALEIAVENETPLVAEEPMEEATPEPDEPPSTRKSRFSQFWFGKGE